MREQHASISPDGLRFEIRITNHVPHWHPGIEQGLGFASFWVAMETHGHRLEFELEEVSHHGKRANRKRVIIRLTEASAKAFYEWLRLRFE